MAGTAAAPLGGEVHNLEEALASTARMGVAAEALEGAIPVHGRGSPSPFGNLPSVALFSTLRLDEMASSLEKMAYRAGGRFHIDLDSFKHDLDGSVIVALPGAGKSVRILLEGESAAELLQKLILPAIREDVEAGMKLLIKHAIDIEVIEDQSPSSVLKDREGFSITESFAARNSHIETLSTKQHGFRDVPSGANEKARAQFRENVAAVTADMFRGREHTSTYTGVVSDLSEQTPSVTRRYHRDDDTFSMVERHQNHDYVGSIEVSTKNGTTLRFNLSSDLPPGEHALFIKQYQRFLAANDESVEYDLRGVNLEKVAAELRNRCKEVIVSSPKIFNDLGQRYPDTFVEMGLDSPDSKQGMRDAQKFYENQRSRQLTELKSKIGEEGYSRLQWLAPAEQEAAYLKHGIPKDWNTLTEAEKVGQARSNLAYRLLNRVISYGIRKDFTETIVDAVARECVPTIIKQGRHCISEFRMTEVWQAIVADKAMFRCFANNMEGSNYTINNTLKNGDAAIAYLHKKWKKEGLETGRPSTREIGESGALVDDATEYVYKVSGEMRMRASTRAITPDTDELKRRFSTPFHWNGVDSDNCKFTNVREIGVDRQDNHNVGTVYKNCVVLNSNARGADFTDVQFIGGCTVGWILLHEVQMKGVFFSDNTKFRGPLDLSGAKNVGVLPIMSPAIEFNKIVQETELWNLMNRGAWFFFGVHPLGVIAKKMQHKINPTAGLLIWDSATEFDPTTASQQFVSLAKLVNCTGPIPNVLRNCFSNVVDKTPTDTLADLLGSMGVDIAQLGQTKTLFQSRDGKILVDLALDDEGRDSLKLTAIRAANTEKEERSRVDAFNATYSVLQALAGRKAIPIRFHDAITSPSSSAKPADDDPTPRVRGQSARMGFDERGDPNSGLTREDLDY